MKKYLWFILTMLGFIFSYKVFADEVAQKTDGSFVGDTFSSNDDVQNKTDGGFVGDNTVQADSSYSSGDSLDNAQQQNTDTPFAQGNAFIGENYGK